MIRAIQTIAVATVSGLGFAANAQPELACNGFDNIQYVGNQPQDFLVPDIVGATVFFTVQGADGGKADVVGLFGAIEESNAGGEGAQATIGCRIGAAQGELAPGGVVRFIVGEAGQDNIEEGFLPVARGGGGGGSAVLYLPPDGDWNADGVILAAAGAGGGAWTTSTLDNDGPGGDGQAGECGGNYFPNPADGGQGGCSGAGGQGQRGGGGAFSAGQETFTGAGGGAGFPSGGAGGAVGSTGNGGWGFGGGAADSGGGGGYSGGGSATGDPQGPPADAGGEGGGSFVNSTFAQSSSGTLAGFSPRSDDGFAQYVIERFIRNSQPQFPDAVFDGAPVSGSFCGAIESGAFACGPAIDGADLWYTYTNPSTCSAIDLTITVTSGDAEFQSYDELVGVPSSANDCRSSSSGGVYTDVLNPGQTIRFRIQSPTGTDFTFVASSSFVGGQPDCDMNGIPDACDIEANPSLDCDGNGILDTCDLAAGGIDCDNDGILDICEPSASCPPPNDLRENAATLVPGTYQFDTRFSTGLVLVDCIPGFSVGTSVWYTFTAPQDGQLVVVADDDVPFAASNTNVQFETPGGDVLACDFIGNGINVFGVDARVVYPISAGETVFILLATGPDGSDGFRTGTLTLTFDPSPSGDTCDRAKTVDFLPGELTLQEPFNFADVQELFTSSPCSGSGRWDIWFKYTSIEGGPVRFTTDENQTAIALFDACGGNELACNYGFFNGTPLVDYVMQPGETVRILVSYGSVNDGFLASGNLILEKPSCSLDLAEPFFSLGSEDVLAFIALADTGDPAADRNADGSVDFFDVLDFLRDLDAGCP